MSRKVGFKHSEETKRKMGLSKIGKERPDMAERQRKNNVAWKGDDVGYRGIHKWINENFGKPIICEICNYDGRWLDWANKNHRYSRNREDWMSLCRKCHKKYDKENNH